MIDLDSLKALYPCPRSVRQQEIHPLLGAYCVGGALAKELGLNYSFPAAIKLTAAIIVANPRISPEKATVHARLIIAYNDTENFEAAWAELGKALET